MRHQYIKQGRWALGVLLATAGASSVGCKSRMPGMNLLGFNREPSAEILAGSGPSVTYPTPPSAGATPEAIASVAGGTATPAQTTPPASQPSSGYGTDQGRIAGLTKPGGAKVNTAAARANGFASAPPTGYPSTVAKPSGYAAAPAPTFGRVSAPKSAPTTTLAADRTPSLPSGYTFGQTKPKSPTPDGLVMGGGSVDNPTTPPTGSANTTSPLNTTGLAASSDSPTTGGFRLPGGYATATAASAKSSVTNGASGFSLPNLGGDKASPAVAAALPTAPTPPPALSTGDESTTAAATSPSFSTATALPSEATRIPASSTAGSGGMDASVTPASGYMPGSTGAASSYPVGGYPTSNASGSFYR